MSHSNSLPQTKHHLFFIGIVGHAMRGLALAAKQAGQIVSGFDEGVPEGDLGGAWIDAQGIPWSRHADSKLLDGVDLVIISGGTPANYPLLAEAKRRRIPIQSFAQYLGQLTTSQHVIAVAGTHGKTTTTSLIAWLIEASGGHPDYLVGIRPFNFDASARLAGADTVVLEGDEYKASSLDPQPKLSYYHPDTLVLTSVEHDHPDVFPDLASVKAAFGRAIAGLPAAGRLVAWAGSSTVTDLARHAPCPVLTYGLDQADYTAANIAYLPGGLSFDVWHKQAKLGRLDLPLYGSHNVLNGLAAVIVGLSEGLSWAQITAAAKTFQGAYRRFNILTAPDAALTVVDDYAHHPTEVAATLTAARQHFPGRRIVAVFRPHTYSRTTALLSEYHQAFASADLAYITDIEAAREQTLGQTITGRDITAGLPVPAHYLPDRTELIAHIRRDSRPGDVLVCMTVSGYARLAEELASRA